MKNIENPPLKIAVIGNSGGGKTRLARRLGQIHYLPVTHVDTIQFLPGMIVRPMPESREILNRVAAEGKWIIDGYGPLDLIEKRFALADRVVFIDFPIWRHIWWCTKRQIGSLWRPRPELSVGCNEANLEQTLKLYKTLWGVHKKMRPELLRIFDRENLRSKMVFYKNDERMAAGF